MKKKVLLILSMVFVFALVLAFSVSAATIYKTSDGTELFRFVDENGDYDYDSYEGSFPKTDESGNALTWYITATETVDSDTVHTVASLKTLGEAGSINANGAYSFTSPVTNKNTVSINFPDDKGIKTWAFSSFGGHGTRANNNILFVYCPNTLTAFANNPFQETNVIVVELDDETPITEIPQNFCHEARNLETINIPTSVTVINGHSGQNGAPFYNCYSLTTVTFASNNKLVEIKNSCFQNCKSLVSIDLPDSVTTMGDHCFSSCSSLEEISLPNSLKTVKNHFFAWCSSLKVIRMGASFEYFNNTGDNSFTYTTGKVEAIYIPKTFYKTAPDTSLSYQVSYAFHGASANCKFFYCGTADEFATAKANFLTQKSATSNNGNFLNATVITYAEYLASPESYATGRYVICEYSECVAFYDDKHVGKTQMVYGDNMYFENADICTVCTRCNDTAVEKTLSPLFKSLGYSYSSNAIMQGFGVNYTVLAEYEAFYEGKEISFGLIATTFANAEDGMLINAEKKAQVDLTTKGYDIFEMKITGIGSENQATSLFLCGYITVGDKTYYLSVGKCNESALDFATSYESVSASGATKIE